MKPTPDHIYSPFMEAERARQRAADVRSLLLVVLVVGMFGAGCVVGYLCH